MIYQCYFKKDQESNLFKTSIYKGFGLEPIVNKSILLNCPELENEKNRLALTEYAAFLNIWRNDVYKLDADWWIGFTSYRQLDKSPVIFDSKETFERCLKIAQGFCGWGFYEMSKNTSFQAEHCHPNINKFIEDVFSSLNIKIPNRFYTDKVALFANYWAMDKHKFIDYVTWSWPIIQKAFSMKDHIYAKTDSIMSTTSKDKWIGYFMERLFILWYMSRNYYPTNFGPICGQLI